MSGREALIEIVFLPVALAVGATLIGIVWMMVAKILGLLTVPYWNDGEEWENG